MCLVLKWEICPEWGNNRKKRASARKKRATNRKQQRQRKSSRRLATSGSFMHSRAYSTFRWNDNSHFKKLTDLARKSLVRQLAGEPAECKGFLHVGFPLIRDFPLQGISPCKGFPLIRDLPLQGIFPLQGISLCKGFPFARGLPTRLPGSCRASTRRAAAGAWTWWTPAWWRPGQYIICTCVCVQWVCVCTYIYIYIYIHTYMYIYTHAYTNICVEYVHVYVCVCTAWWRPALWNSFPNSIEGLVGVWWKYHLRIEFNVQNVPPDR